MKTNKPTNQLNRFHNQLTNKTVFKTNKPIKPTNQLTSSNLTNKTALKTILLFFLSSFLFLPSAVYALDFDGSLKGVTITDTSGTNTPPNAVISHTTVSETPFQVNFDAGGSSDPDGSISEYRWDFGDGSTETGAAVSHQFVTEGPFPVTLTVVDNMGGMALSQVAIATTAGRVTEGLLLLYTFQAGSGNIVYDNSNVGSPMNLTINNTNNVNWLSGGGLSVVTYPILISSEADTKIATACMASNEITIDAWIKPANTSQEGPARIVTLSQDSGYRNFTLGQVYSAYDVRLRTTTTGTNGVHPSTRTGDSVVETSFSHIVYTRNAAGVAKVYKNGIEVKNATIGGDLSNWNSSYRFGLANELNSDRPWLGDLHLVAVYDRALSAEEVTFNFEADF